MNATNSENCDTDRTQTAPVARRVRFRAAGALALSLVLSAALVSAVPPAAHANGDPIDIVDSGVIYSGSSAEPVVISTLAKSASGDLLAFFNTGTDGESGVSIKLTTSSDDGATWSTPVTFAAPASSNRRVSAGSATTLADGTILLPFNDQEIIHPYLDRSSDIYIARSTDGGATWTGKTTPVTISPDWYNAFQFGEIVELDSGELLMPVWGSRQPPASTNYSTLNAEPLESGVLRSDDDGATWSSFSPFDTDPVAPMRTFPQAAGTNDTTIVKLRDGRLMATVRYDQRSTDRDGYVTYSGDDGYTWSGLRRTGIEARGPAAFVAACSNGLSGNDTKVIYATADGANLRLYATYDAGVTYSAPTNVTLPSGVSNPIYADFEYLSDGRLFVLFTGSNRLAFNIVEESSSSECAAERDASDSDSDATTTVYLERSTETPWDFRFGRSILHVDPSTTLASLRTTAAAALGSYGEGTLYKNGVPLPLLGTLDDAGVQSGDMITVATVQRSASEPRVGFTDYDIRPLTRTAGNFDTHLGFRAALDAAQRSLVVRQPLEPGESISSISVRDSNSSNSVTGTSTTVYSSADGATWTEVAGTSFSSTTVGGRKIVTFGSLGVTDEFVKVRFDSPSSGYTLVVHSREDVTVTVSP